MGDPWGSARSSAGPSSSTCRCSAVFSRTKEGSLARGADTPARAIGALLNRHGYTKTQAELAQVLRICDKNVSRYLLPVGHRHRISPRLDTISGWCWSISQTTGLSLRIVVDSSAEVVIEASGYSAQGEPIEEESVLTSYREVDASPAKSWAEEWTKFMKRYKSFYTV